MKAPRTVPRVLLIEEHTSIGRSMGRVLETLGVMSLVVHSVSEGLRLLSQADVIVLGVDGQEGAEFLKNLSVQSNSPPVIVHVNSLDSPTALWALEQHIYDVVEKPLPAKVLVERVKQLVGLPGRPRSEYPKQGAAQLLGESAAVDRVREQVARVSSFSGMSVLIAGETGTGKELVAQAIHEMTNPDAPLVSVNCAAIPESLFESELFGHGAGAFTSAKGNRAGLMEEAANGTIFLDEVGELPPSLQPKLLRVLETRRFRRVGSNRELPLLARVITATNRQLQAESSGFRPDLYYRLAGYTIHTPPLRDRREDIASLARFFLQEFCTHYGKSLQFEPGVIEMLSAQDWPGNIRELRGAVEFASVSASQGIVSMRAIEMALGERCVPSSATFKIEPLAPPSSRQRLVGSDGAFPSLTSLERHVILEALDDASGNLSLAARTLGIARSTLRDKLKKYRSERK